MQVAQGEAVSESKTEPPMAYKELGCIKEPSLLQQQHGQFSDHCCLFLLIQEKESIAQPVTSIELRDLLLNFR